MNTLTEIQNQGLKALNEVYNKAWNSSEFKEKLIKYPTEALSEVVGHPLSPDYRFIVEDQSDSNIIYLNIPAKYSLDSIELSDEQLEIVAGGEIGVLGYCVIVGAVCLVSAGVGYAVGYANNTK